MRFATYRSLLRLPGMRTFMLIGLFARIPATATSSALTLSVVLDLHRGYGDAGLVTAAYTVGLAIGSPLLGRLVDRRGPRPVLVLTGVAALVFWLIVPALPYEALLVAGLFGGLLQVPITGLVRQSLASRVAYEQRRQAYSLDSMCVEISFMIGPALAILAITQLGDAVSTMRTLGIALAAAAAVMFAYNPKVGSPARQESDAVADGADDADGSAETAALAGRAGRLGRADKPNWLAPAFLLVLCITCTSAMVMAGTDVSIVATLRSHGQTQWAGVVIIAWCLASMIGGFIHGALPKPLSTLTLALLVAVLTIPAGIVHDWQLLALALFPAGLLCAPTISSTVDQVSRTVPESARGEAIGRHYAALTVGNALGAPLAGAVIDKTSPAFGFASVGGICAGLTLAAIGGRALVRARRSRRPSRHRSERRLPGLRGGTLAREGGAECLTHDDAGVAMCPRGRG